MEHERPNCTIFIIDVWPFWKCATFVRWLFKEKKRRVLVHNSLLLKWNWAEISKLGLNFTDYYRRIVCISLSHLTFINSTYRFHNNFEWYVTIWDNALQRPLKDTSNLCLVFTCNFFSAGLSWRSPPAVSTMTVSRLMLLVQWKLQSHLRSVSVCKFVCENVFLTGFTYNLT